MIFKTALCAMILAASVSFAADRRVAPLATITTDVEHDSGAVEKETDTARGELIDINSAPKKQLKALKGIGVEYSDRIIAGRPYANKEQLVTKKIIPKEIFEAVKDHIIAKQQF